MLVKHLRFWGEAVPALVDHEVVVDLTVIDDAALGERIRDTVQPQLQALHLRDSPGRTQGIGYYRSAAFKIILCSDDGTESELGDGGFTAWTATLTADAKERCLISCVSSERLAQLAKHDHQASLAPRCCNFLVAAAGQLGRRLAIRRRDIPEEEALAAAGASPFITELITERVSI